MRAQDISHIPEYNGIQCIILFNERLYDIVNKHHKRRVYGRIVYKIAIDSNHMVVIPQTSHSLMHDL